MFSQCVSFVHPSQKGNRRFVGCKLAKHFDQIFKKNLISIL